MLDAFAVADATWQGEHESVDPVVVAGDVVATEKGGGRENYHEGV